MTLPQLFSTLIGQSSRSLPGLEQRQFACRVSRRSLLSEQARGRHIAAVSWELLDVAERYIVGQATDEDRNAAKRSAAGNALDSSSFHTKISCCTAIMAAQWDCAASTAVQMGLMHYQATNQTEEYALQLSYLLDRLAR